MAEPVRDLAKGPMNSPMMGNRAARYARKKKRRKKGGALTAALVKRSAY